MTDYILVPVEPTPEMVEAAEEAHMPFGDMELAIRMALLAAPDHIADTRKMVAPAVQGEPVGWVWHSYNQTNFTSGSHHKEVLEADGVKLTPVYTAPQPVEQPPLQRQSVLNLSEAARCLGIAQEKGDQDAIDHWGAMVARFERVLIQSAEQHPDVAQLVEALDGAARSLETISRQAGIDEYMRDFSEVRGYAQNRAMVAFEALAAHRKQQEGEA